MHGGLFFYPAVKKEKVFVSFSQKYVVQKQWLLGRRENKYIYSCILLCCKAEDNHGPYNVVFQELAKFTGIAEGVQKILEASDNVLGVFLALFLGKEILTNYCLRPGNTGNIFLHLAT